MIVRSVLPLLIEHGTAITTSQIAKAACIGEGTIFRVFKDKDELIDACMTEALRPDAALSVIAEIPLDQPLETRLVEAAEVMYAHLQRMGAVMSALFHSGRPHHRGERPRKSARQESTDAMRAAIAELFEPERESLRVPVDQAAALFLSMMMMQARSFPDGPTAKQLIDVFLHGALEAE
ncbi:DNA-binding transcriptional regulator, AcrR family [Amycolatopsis xylanica]|uniref:DNA-binding transcriptional regulator, AcrR family n=2 Tax=Amycolatopsis xylanica TaxID=589385 RepID=A0A1H3ADW9_9PSEU|nr:DNA-binding transcriptional regulator, AcrR family [Amycolatopsis xylanica]